LENRDEELREIIIEIQKEELQHLEYAESNLKASLLTKPLSYLISLSTEIAIYLSTQGDVSKMRNAIKIL
jgi:demethoxyubiquinone hydroxylase (CLK1/Coq7/Cat5 family)